MRTEMNDIERWKILKSLLDEGLLNKSYMRESDETYFIRSLEKKRMSDWTAAEMKLYNELTGQIRKECLGPNDGSHSECTGENCSCWCHQ